MQQETMHLAKTMRAHVHNIRLLYQPLVLLSERKVRVDNGAGRSSEEPLPVNVSALQLVCQVDEIAVMLARAAGWDNPHDLGTIGRLIWLDDDGLCATLAQRDDADHIEPLLASLHRRMEWMLYGNSTRKYIGVCPHCRWGVWLLESDDLSGTRHCERCDGEFDVRQVCQAHRLRLLMTDYADTLHELAILLRSCGYRVKMNTLKSWVRRGRLQSIGTNDDGIRVYRVADVIRLCNLLA